MLHSAGITVDMMFIVLMHSLHAKHTFWMYGQKHITVVTSGNDIFSYML